MNHQGDFVKRILKDKKITQEQLADDIHVSRGQVVKLLKNIELKEDSKGTVGRILDHLQIKVEDLPIISKEEKIAFLSGIIENVGDKKTDIHDAATAIMRKLQADRGNYPAGEIPVYNDKSAASAVELYNDEKEYEPAFTVKIPQFADCEFGKMNYGHSMYPTYENGTYLFMKRVGELRQVAFGEVYYIETKYLKITKRLQSGKENDHFLALSDNDEKRPDGGLRYEPFPIYKEDIINLFLVKGSLKQSQN